MKEIELVPSYTNEADFEREFLSYIVEIRRYVNSNLIKDTPKDYAEGLKNTGGVNRYFVKSKGKTIGILVMEYIDDFCHIGKPKWYLTEFYIKTDYRHQGYGRALFARCISEFGADCCFYVLKNNKPAMSFWSMIERKFDTITRYLNPYVPEQEGCITYCFKNSFDIKDFHNDN